MKKIKTKILALLCVALLLVNIIGITLTASAATDRVAMTFTSGFESLFYSEKKLTALPQTFEADIKVPTKANDQYWGDILAANNDKNNYDGFVWDLRDASNQVETRFLCIQRGANGTTSEVVVRFVGALEEYRGQDIHLALVLDTTNSKVSLYINGQKWNGTPTYSSNVQANANEAGLINAYKTLNLGKLPYFTMGGDFREMIPQGSVNPWYSVWGVDNYRFFRGGIYSAAVFSDVRTASEISDDVNGVVKGTDKLMMLYDTSNVTSDGLMADLSGNGYDLTGKSIWFSERSAIGDYAYSFVVVGDTQVVARDESVTDGGTHSLSFIGNFNKIFDYIVDNKEEKNIQFAFHMGDITDWNNDSEWKTAMTGINKMNGLIPYNLVRGNHDASDKYIANYTIETFESNVAQGEEFGSFDDNTLNTYQTLTVGEVKYLMLALDLGPSKAVIEWANEVVESHPEHNVIISTHSYLHRSGAFMDDPLDCSATQYNPGGKYNGGSYKENGNSVYWDFRLQKYKDAGEDYLYQDASYMWENLVKKHENICMVLCGHECSDLILKVDAVGDHGNKIVQLLIDAQDVDRRLQGAGLGHAGLVAMLYFSEDGKTVSTEYYSTIREQYFMTDNIYTFELDLVGDDDDSDNGSDNGGENNNGSNNGNVAEDENNNGSNNGNANNDATQPGADDDTNTIGALESEDEGGCGSVMSVSAVGIVTLGVLGAGFIPKRRRK